MTMPRTLLLLALALVLAVGALAACGRYGPPQRSVEPRPRSSLPTFAPEAAESAEREDAEEDDADGQNGAGSGADDASDADPLAPEDDFDDGAGDPDAPRRGADGEPELRP